MAIYDILNEVKDRRGNEDGICTFNGFLEDYLSMIEEDEEQKEVYNILNRLFEMDSNLKIAVDLRLNINKEAIANQIIRYKDSFKLPRGTIRAPYVVYGMFNDYQKAVILMLGGQEEYILAKGLYYVISEPENEYEGTRNEIIATSVNEDSVERMVESVHDFFVLNKKAGIVQRRLDSITFESYDQMYDMAKEMADYQQAHLQEILEASDNREEKINQLIAKWFLLKKFSYVQYMMDKNNLNHVHEGNVKKQRQVAKEKCDAICFVSYSELWRMSKNMNS